MARVAKGAAFQVWISIVDDFQDSMRRTPHADDLHSNSGFEGDASIPVPRKNGKGALTVTPEIVILSAHSGIV